MKGHFARVIEMYEWDLSCTFTTRYPLRAQGASRLMNNLCKVIKAPQKSKMFWITEAFLDREGCHIHALIKTSLPDYIIKKWWEKNYGGCSVYLFDNSTKGTHYITKCIDGNKFEYDIII